MASSPQAGATPQDVTMVHPEKVMDSNVGLQPENPCSFSAHQRRSGHHSVVQGAGFHPYASDSQPWYDHMIQQRLQGQVPRVMPRASMPDMLHAPRHVDMRKYNPPMLYPTRYYPASLTLPKDISVGQHNTSTPAVPTWNNSTLAYGASFPQQLGRSWPRSFHDQIPTNSSRTFCNACNFSDITPSGTRMPAVQRFPDNNCFSFNSCTPLQFMRPLASSHLRALAAPAGSQTVINFSSAPEQRLVSSGSSTIKSVHQSELVHNDGADIGKKTVTVELNGVRHVLEVPADSPMLYGRRPKQASIAEDTRPSVKLRNLLLGSTVSGPTQPGSPVFVLSGGACQTTPTTKIPISAVTPCRSQSTRQVKESHSVLVSMLKSRPYSREQEHCVDKVSETCITDTSRTCGGKGREFDGNVRKTKTVEEILPGKEWKRNSEKDQTKGFLHNQTNSLSNINKMRNMKNIRLKDVIDFTVAASCHTGQGSLSEKITSDHGRPNSKGRKKVKRKRHHEPVPVKGHIKPETALKLKLKMKKFPEPETKKPKLDSQNVCKKSYGVIKESQSPLVTRRRGRRSSSVFKEDGWPSLQKLRVRTRGRRSVLTKAESVTYSANLKDLRVVLRRVNLDGMTSINIREKAY